MISSNWQVDFNNEIEHAQVARQNGNEGMARVCARRAAGVVIGEYLTRRGLPNPDHNVYERLQNFNRLTDVDSYYKNIASHFLLKVDLTRNLPTGIDLISDASILKQGLLDN